RPSRDPAGLPRAHPLPRRPHRAGRAAGPADARRVAADHRQPRDARPHARSGGERRDRQARTRALPGPRRPHGAAAVHAHGRARAGAGLAPAGMKFGIALSVQHLPDDPQGSRFRQHLEQVRLARAVGFTSAWASQHYLSDPFTYFQPIPTLARVAAEAPGLRGAARVGDGWLMNPHATLSTLERQQALFRSTRRDLGRPAATETPLIKECYVAPEPSTAFAESAAFLDAKYRAYRRWEQDKALPPGESFAESFEELARDRFVIGDPAGVAEEIARYRERLGVTTLIFRLQWPGMDQAKVLRSIRLLGE